MNARSAKHSGCTSHPLSRSWRGLFCKVHIDTMVMPRSGGYCFIVQAQCALTAYLEWCMLWSENAVAITSFIFEDILCYWGAISELVTDNGSPYIQALDILASWYRIHHVQISPYNSQAKWSSNSTMMSRRPSLNPPWEGKFAGLQLLIPFSSRESYNPEANQTLTIFHGTWHRISLPIWLGRSDIPSPSTRNRPGMNGFPLAWRAWQLQKRQEDINTIQEHVLMAHYALLRHFKAQFKNHIQSNSFDLGDLVLVQNTWIKKELN